VVPRRAAHGGSTPPGTWERCRNRIQKIFFCNLLAGSEAGRVVEHCICAKLRGVALSVIIVVWEDVHTTPRLATK
jgi:hypothetical protein